MVRNLARLTNAANRMQAREDWARLAEKARTAGYAELVERLCPPADAGWRRIDAAIAELRAALGVEVPE